jgi:hypothetical protein
MRIANRDPMRSRQLASMLSDEPWIEAAEFAAYGVQIEALALKPWESPPCVVDEDEAGLSRYEPDPKGALS